MSVCRAAEGIFTGDDVGILMAIINHVAVSLETVRAAQLELAVQAARQQRDLAETLRSAMSEVSQTLDPDEVLRRLLVAAMPITTESGPLPATISVGIADLHPDDPDLGTLLARADAALYRAKRQGRNRVASA